jgi:glycosyltransferase involved in cell wall biosynthesis
MNRTILSVLIPTIKDRSVMFHRLYIELVKQVSALHEVHPTLGTVEVLFNDSAKFLEGGLSIGKKRESLVRAATGKYLCFCDDDEWVSPNYIETLVRVCHHDRDVVTFRNFTRLDTFWTIIDMSLNFPNDQASPLFTVRRKPWHICPVRSLFAKRVQFQDTNYSEDFDWMGKVLEFCTSEAKTDAVLHEYHHGKHSEADKITAHALSK